MPSLSKLLFCIANFVLFTSNAIAGTMEAISSPGSYQHVISLFGGYASINHSGRSQTYLGTDDEVFAYNGKRNNKNTELVGVFLGEEFNQLTINPSLLFQAGIEYTYFGKNHLSGSNTAGVEPETSTLYRYDYTLQSQQLLAVAKILATTHQVFHPYLSVGIGASSNDSRQFSQKTQELESINLAPRFANHRKTAFSYSLGLGLDVNVSAHLRMGAGYRFSGLGHSSLGNGSIVFNNYNYPTSFGLHTGNVYVNQAVFQASYLA
ncbi:Opacity protein antigens [Legionella massiliensis]|uniref:Opacity protein antigens n=1 Tax=Legionella massiliensis TaxID=1034943 RepID=A0A078KWQ6_9GAMM|nr:outer membrane beta-barrel protein [Legionella massiliensis]CDZ76194.1 Opacity protein antigens [Legionella massiliensis]CEE11932.1 OmpA-like transmembrane domain protein [Legionella massiliensis]